MTSTPMTIPPDSPFGRLLFPLLGATVAVSFFVTRHSSAPGLTTALAGLLAVGYLPGLAFSLWSERRFGLWASWILPLLLAPVLVAGLTLVMTSAGVPLEDAASWIVLASVLAVVTAPQPVREIEDWAVSLEMPSLIRRRSDRQQVVLFASVVLVLLAWPMLQHDWLRTTLPAGQHTALVREVNRGLPPWDPFLAGYTYRGPWAFHVYVAVLDSAARVGGGTLLIGGSLIAAFVTVFAGYRAVTLLGFRHAQALWGTVFVFFTLGSTAWARRMIVPGLGAGFPEAGANGMQMLPFDRTFFLEPFVGMFPLVWGIAYFLLFMIAGAATIGDPRRSWNALLFLAGAGMLLFQPDIGMLAILVGVVAVPVIWALSGLHPVRDRGLQVGLALIPLLLAVAVTAPYLREILRTGAVHPSALIAVSATKTRLLVLAVAPQLVLAAAVLAGMLASSETRRHAWAAFSVLLAAWLLVLEFPEPSFLYKAVVVLHLPLALAAGTAVPWVWDRVGRPLRVLVVAVLVLLVVPGAYAHAVWFSRLGAAGAASPADEEAVRWVAEHTPAHAVLIDHETELAMAANRILLVGGDERLTRRSHGANPDAARTDAYVRLLGGRAVRGPARDDLLSLEAPVYVVWRLEDRTEKPPAPETREVFRNDAYAIHLWEPSMPSSE